MAKKKKKSEEEIEDQNQEFNDIDENFGLPDLDYKPVDEVEEEEEEDTSAVSEESEQEEPTYTYDEPEADEEEETTAEQQSYAYDPVDEPAQTNDETSDSDTSGYVPGTYARKLKEDTGGNKTVGIIVLVAVIIIAAAGGYWFFVMRPAQLEAEKAKQEELAKQNEESRKKTDYEKLIADGDAAVTSENWSNAKSAYSQASAIFQEEQYPKDQLAMVQGKLDEIAAAAAKPKIGEINTISAAMQRYHVVVSSSIDGDLAMDYAKKISAGGDNVGIIAPYGKNVYYRVTLGNYPTWQDAEAAVSSFSGTYGNGIWILKY